MAVTPKNFHEVDPDEEFEVVPPSVIDDVAADCCTTCTVDPSPCSDERGIAAFTGLAAGQVVAFWYI